MGTTVQFYFGMILQRFIAAAAKTGRTSGIFTQQIPYSDLKIRQMTPSIRSSLKSMALTELVDPQFFKRYDYMRIAIDFDKKDNAVDLYHHKARLYEERNRRPLPLAVAEPRPHLGSLLGMNSHHSAGMGIILETLMPKLTRTEEEQLLKDILNHPEKSKQEALKMIDSTTKPVDFANPSEVIKEVAIPFNFPVRELTPEEKEKMVGYLDSKLNQSTTE